MKKYALIAVSALMLMACANTAGKETTVQDTTITGETTSAQTVGDTYKIGVLQLVQHPALDSANEGFFAALDEAGISYTADQQNAGGEQSNAQTIAEKLVNDKNDLIFAIATPAAQAAAAATEEIPIVLTAVTDPESSGLVESNEVPGGNITGSSDLTPVAAQIDLLTKLIPDAKNIAILYSSAEANSAFQAEIAHSEIEAKGMTYEDYTVSSLNEIQSVLESMIGKVDAIYIPTDNMMAASMSTITMIATENKIPVIGAEVAHVEAGALATYGINYYSLGYLAGKQAIAILTEGKSPAQMPIEYLGVEGSELSVNEETAALLGIDVSVLQQ